MTEVKCKIGELTEVCDLISMKGKNPQGKEYTAVPDFMAKASAGTLEVYATDSKNAIALNLKYKVEAISEEGNLPISDVAGFKKYLERFNATDVVTLKTTQNRILITRETPKKIARIPLSLSDPSKSGEAGVEAFNRFPLTSTGYPKSPKTHLSLKIVVDSGKLTDVVRDGDVVNQRIYPWKIDGNLFSINVGSEQLGEIETVIGVEKIEGDPEKPRSEGTKTSFSYGFDNLFSNLSGVVEIYIADGVELCPLYLVKHTDKYDLKAILAPMSME